MKTTAFKPWFCRILCILFFITTTFGIAAPDIRAVDPGDDPAVSGNNSQDIPVLELPQMDGPLYLECSLPKTRFYQGERIPITITLYISELAAVKTIDEPVLNQPEFLLDKLGNPIQKQVRINGRPHQVIKFSYLLSPLKTGAFQLGPIKQNCYLASEISGKRRIIETTSKRITVNVQALPGKGRPDFFSGAVGNFQLTVNAASRRVLQGNPLTLRMTLSGNGNLQGVAAPILQSSPGLKAFNPLKKNELSTERAFWQRMVFEQTVIPLDVKLKRIGPFKFAYFDPNQGKYRQLSIPAIPVQIKANPAFKKDSTPAAGGGARLTLAPLKTNPGIFRQKNRQLLNHPGFWLWQLLPLLLLTGAIIYRRYMDLLHSDSPRARALRSTNLAKQQLAAAQIIAGEGRYEDLLEQLHDILREYLGERFAIPAAGMTGAVADSLTGKELPPEILKDIRSFFEQYDMHCFAKTSCSQDEVLLLQQLVTTIIDTLDKQ